MIKHTFKKFAARFLKVCLIILGYYALNYAKVFLKIKTFKDFFKITNKRVLEIFGSKSK